MKKVYVKIGDAVSIVIKTNTLTSSIGIAGKVCTVTIINEAYGSVHTLSVGSRRKKATQLPLNQLGFYFDQKGVYYQTIKQIKL